MGCSAWTFITGPLQRSRPIQVAWRNASAVLEWSVGSAYAILCSDNTFNQFLWSVELNWMNFYRKQAREELQACFHFEFLSDDSPPSIRIKILSGSGTFEPSGVLAVLPGTTVYLDCMYPKKKGSPDWTWTGWHRTYQTCNTQIHMNIVYSALHK